MNISDVGFFKEKLRSQTFFEVPPDCYCTSVNTTWHTVSLIQDHSEPAPTFLNLYQYYADIATGKQLYVHSAMVTYTSLVIRGTDKNKQLTNIKPTQTGINRNK
jgi:hypothetical protein